MAAQQIAELFGSVGFKIDANSWKTLDKFENKLDTIKKKIDTTFSGKVGGMRSGGSGSAAGGRGGQNRGRGGRTNLSLAGSALSNMHTIGMFLTGGALVGTGINILQTAAKYDALESSMLAATGTASLAKDELKFLEDTSRRLGLVTTEIARPFTNFSVAAKENGVAADETRKIFTQFTEASRGLNLTADDTAGVFRALSQMFSKSTVQSEELKGQLGERLPGAYAIAARVMGLTTEEMGKQLKAGKILAKDLVPKLAAEYQRLVTSTGSLDKALQSTSFRLGRLSEEWNKFLKRLADGKTGKVLNQLLTRLTSMLEANGKDGGVLDAFISKIGILADALVILTDTFMSLATVSPMFAAGLGTIAAAVAFVISPVTRLITGLVLLLLALEDIVAFTQGKDSLTGRMFKSISSTKSGIPGDDGELGFLDFVPQFHIAKALKRAWEGASSVDPAAWAGTVFDPFSSLTNGGASDSSEASQGAGQTNIRIDKAVFNDVEDAEGTLIALESLTTTYGSTA